MADGPSPDIATAILTLGVGVVQGFPAGSIQNSGAKPARQSARDVTAGLNYADNLAMTVSGMSRFAYTFFTSSLSSSASSSFNIEAAWSSSSVTLVVGRHSTFALSGGRTAPGLWPLL